MDVRYFRLTQLREALEFARAGGVAVHRNFDFYDGTVIRGVARPGPFLHVLGLRPLLERWGSGLGLRPEWVQPEHRGIAHFDLHGWVATQVIERITQAGSP